MKSASSYKDNFLKKERFKSLVNTTSLLFYTTCLTILCTSIYLLYYQRNINYATNNIQQEEETNRTNTTIVRSKNGSETCDLFKGQWIQEDRGSLYYTNYSCKTIPLSRNCFLHGRKDRDFLNWRWKPEQCELPHFSPETFLTNVRGKTMAFIGDSLARNQMESLLCLLSSVESPTPLHKDAEDKFATWEFRQYNFTLMALWSQFLVTSTERIINGSASAAFDLHLDKADTKWSEKLPSMDYVIFSDAQWFFRQNHLYEGGKHIGCVYCEQGSNMTSLGPGPTIRRAFRAALAEINNCKNCKKISTFLRTYSATHFENGVWNMGGSCNRTWPIRRDEVDEGGAGWEYRKIQVEEIEIARNAGVKSGNSFETIDVTEMMAVRVDGHPGVHWGNIWMKGYSDCVHWCLPGPIDTWNELLFELIRRRAATLSP